MDKQEIKNILIISKIKSFISKFDDIEILEIVFIININYKEIIYHY